MSKAHIAIAYIARFLFLRQFFCTCFSHLGLRINNKKMSVCLVYGLVPPWSSGRHAHLSWCGSQDQIPQWTLAYQEKHGSVSQ